MAIISGIISGITALAGIGAGIYGAVKSSKKAKEATDKFQEIKAVNEANRREEDEWFNRQYLTDMTNRVEVQDTLRRAGENMRVQQKRAEARAANVGATDEALLAEQNMINKNYADATAQIASNLSTLRDQSLNNYRNRVANLNNQYLSTLNNEYNLLNNQSVQAGNMSMNGFGTMGAATGSMIDSLYKYKTPTA